MSESTLNDSGIGRDPIIEFKKWFEEAVGSGMNEPEAIALATASESGQPSARMVLMKKYDESGFVFFTNYESRKGQELAANTKAAAVFWWDRLGRQVRIEGKVEKISAKESDRYFSDRPRGHQIGSWASNQSRGIRSREELMEKVESFRMQFEGETIKRPPHWGGFLLKPDMIEFWQGRDDRLADRIRYTKQNNQSWKTERLSP